MLKMKEEHNTYSSLSCLNVFIGPLFSGLFITRLAKPNSLGFYGKYAYFIKQLCLTHIWLFVASKKIAAVGTFPHLSLKSKAMLERTEHRTALIDCNYCTNILIA